ncbi:MAG: ABC transporter substrate binding protein [Bacillota bacterium]
MSPSRRRVLVGLALTGLALPRPLLAAGATVKRVLVQREPIFNEKGRKRLAKLFANQGLVEGRDIAIEFVDLGDGDWPENEVVNAARKAVQSRPDVILAWGESAPLFKRLTADIPIVFHTLDMDPVRVGLVESLNLPGGNVTGTLDGGLDVVEKCWELAKDVRPSIKRFGTLIDDLPDGLLADLRIHQERAAKRLGVQRVEIRVPLAAPFPQVERAIASAKVEALDISLSVEHPRWEKELMAALVRMRIVGVWPTLVLVVRGGLLSVMGNGNESREVAVQMAAKILRGAPASQIPIYNVKTFVTSINLRTADAMRLEIPSAVLLRANWVMEKDGTSKGVQW